MARLALLTLVAALALAAPAAAVDRYVPMKGARRRARRARVLGLRLRHGREIDLPLYAYSTSLTKGRVARGARRLARFAPIDEATVVDDHNARHLDPLAAAACRNRFVRTVVPFLRRIARSR